MLSFLDRAQPLGLLALRVVAGVIMVAHGSQKVFGGLQQHMAFVAKLGMPAWMAYLSTGAEFIGGLLLIVGLLTRLAALAICVEMLVTIFKIHLPKGLMGPGASEFPLLMATATFALVFFGAGPISLDWVFGAKGAKR